MSSVDLAVGEVICQPNKPITHVYFIESGIVSALTLMKNGTTVESGLIGKEGMVGLPLVLGIDHPTQMFVVQSAGRHLQMTANYFKEAVKSHSELCGVLLRFSGIFNSQVMQLGACNATHRIAQRCCRWLLMWQDRLNTSELPVTQEYLSHMLGVRRSSISEVLAPLKSANLITIKRGAVTIQNSVGIKALACECYSVMKEDYASMLPPL